MAASTANDRVKPTAQSPRGQYLGRVVSNTRICTEHYRLVLRVGGFPRSLPGQFVQLECRPTGQEPTCHVEHEWTPGSPVHVADPDFLAGVAYLRRPFSIAGRRDTPDGSADLDIIHRVVGRGTRWLEQLADGAEVSVLGPLGNGFAIRPDTRLALLVGGGVGIPPMFYMAEALHRAGTPAVGLVGAQRKDLVPLTISPCMPAPSPAGDPVLNATEFADHGYPTVVTTDDGSLGMKGFVTAALKNLLESQKQKGPDALRNVLVYCCGPTAMMRATAAVVESFGVECQVSLEQPMACGMGTCQSCVVRWAPTGTPRDQWTYKLTCTDGPVFDSREIVW